MADKERKRLVWAIKRGLHNLTAEEIFGLIQSIGPVDELDPDRLDENDEDSCIDYLPAYMSSSSLLRLEDEGISWLLHLKDEIEGIIESHSESPVNQQVNTEVDANIPVLLHSLPTERANTNIYTGSVLTEVTSMNTDTHGTHTQASDVEQMPTQTNRLQADHSRQYCVQ